ncbi:MAG: sugar transferase, partial [Geminicoccales bacterium]
MGLIVGLVTTVLFALHGMYDVDRAQGWFARLHFVVSSVSTALVLAVAVSTLLGDQRFSRLWFAAGWGIAVAGLTLWRALGQTLYAAVRDVVAPANRVLIVGANPLGRELARELAGHRRVAGYVDNGSDLDNLDDQTDLPLLGPIARLDRIVQTEAIDEVILALPAERREQVSTIIARGFHRRVQIKIVPDLDGLFSHLPRRFEIDRLGGRPYIGFVPAAKVSWIKRAVDLVTAGFGLLAISPLLLAVTIAIKLDSPGPVFYRQERVGKNGKRFRIFKFRSMRPGADRSLGELRQQNEASGPLFKMKRDPRVTRVGTVLRRWSLDELPQLF